MSPREGRGPAHLPALDGVRGLATLMVLLFHFNGHVQFRFLDRPATDPLTLLLLRVSNYGWIGVDLFFVLSGFLITGILIAARSSPNYYRTFYVRRALRIFPLYFGFLSICLLAAPLFVPPNTGGFSSAIAHQGYLWLYASNFAEAFAGIQFGPLGHLWSLAVEEHFYLVWPVLVRVCPAKRLPHLCLLCIVVAPAARLAFVLSGFPAAAHVLMPSRLDAFGIGGLCAVIAHGAAHLPTQRSFGRVLLATSTVFVAAMCAFVPLSARLGSVLNSVFQYSFYACVSASLIWFASSGKDANHLTRFLTVRPLRVFGRYSYGMYVLHVPMIPILYLTLQRLLRFVSFEIRSELAMATVFVVFGIVCVLLASAASFHLFETPFLSLKARFSYSDSAASAAGPTVASR